MRDQFWIFVCTFLPVWKVGLAVTILIFLLSAFSFLGIEHGTESYYILQFTIITTIPLLIVTILMIFYCSRE